MTKKNILLDFTSLLDVIMIILFVVICKLGQASLEANVNAEAAQQQAAETQEALETAEASLEAMTQQEAALTAKVEELEAENATLKAMEGEESFDRDQVLENLLGDSISLQLICTTYTDETKSASNLVSITIYEGLETEEMEASRIVTFVHDFELSPEKRALRNAQMQKELFEALKAAWEGTDAEFVLVTVQYTYSDVNFSKTDLDLIYGAVEDLERECNIKCFINKIKL